MYQHVLKLGREREGAILLDLGCCFGTDIRKVASDGWPLQSLIASDLRPGIRHSNMYFLVLSLRNLTGFWNLGHELFRSTPETFAVAFLAGDALDPTFIEPAEPLASPSEVVGPAPSLASLTSLTPLRGHVSAIHISSVFHLFFEPQQLQLARVLAGLLSPVPGSVIFGSHGGMRSKGFNEGSFCSGGHHMFCHSPESWREMWEVVFPNGNIQVEAELKRRSDDPTGERSTGILRWSVTRV